MKQVIAWFLVFMILFSSASLLRDPGQQEWENPYIDVTQDMWSYQYITELNKAGVLPSGAVSYTHLDVYKRQRNHSSNVTPHTATFIPSLRKVRSNSAPMSGW